MVVASVLGAAAGGRDGGVVVPSGELGAFVEAERTTEGERGGGPRRWREDRNEGYEEEEGKYYGCRLSKLDLFSTCADSL
jgi:hypothetical protein